MSRVAWAQSYRTRPVRLIVPYAAGGGTDAIARLVAQAVGEKLGQTVVVENNGVGAGHVGDASAEVLRLVSRDLDRPGAAASTRRVAPLPALIPLEGEVGVAGDRTDS